jgi:hypothetical protein
MTKYPIGDTKGRSGGDLVVETLWEGIMDRGDQKIALAGGNSIEVSVGRVESGWNKKIRVFLC